MSDDTPVTLDAIAANGDLPLDAIERAVSDLISAVTPLHAREDKLKAELAAVREQRSRIDRALNALTAPKVDRSASEQAAVKKTRGPGKKSGPRNQFDPAVTQAAKGYPSVSEAKQLVVLDALKAVGRPVGPGELSKESGLNKSTVSNGLAHLRARGLVRWAGGSGQGRGHLYAPWNEGEVEDDSITESGGSNLDAIWDKQ
jgi:hypothetical protein